jgi:hypothetical protein
MQIRNEGCNALLGLNYHIVAEQQLYFAINGVENNNGCNTGDFWRSRIDCNS